MRHAETRAYSLAEIISRLGGELVGDPAIPISGIASLYSAGPTDISFLTRGKYRSRLMQTRAAAVILHHRERESTTLPRILCEDPYAYFARLSALLHPRPAIVPVVHPSAVIGNGAQLGVSVAIGPACHVAKGARIGDRVSLGAGCVVGEESSIGDDSVLYPCSVVYHGCIIGRRAVLHSGAVIGSDGFGMAMHEDRWLRIPQVGGVVLGDDVEIGAGTTVDRGTLDDTVIEDDVKLDNQIQIGHNVRVGAHTAMAGCVGVAGSAKIGRYCTIGGGAIILGHIEIADHVHISAGTLISKSIHDPGTYTGVFPFQTYRDWARGASLLRNIERLEARIRALEHKLARLEDKD